MGLVSLLKSDQGVRRRRRLSSGGVGLFLALLIPFSALSEGRYPESLWAEDLLEKLRSGPSLFPADLDLRVPPPPSEAETGSELDWLEGLATTARDESTVHLIRIEADAALSGLLRASGLIPDPAAAPTLWGLLALVEAETAYFVLREKRVYARLRPGQLRPGLDSVIATPAHPSYPSGHAAQASAAARLLSALHPACAESYRRFAAGVGLRREIAGVHYPSDTRAGERLAETLVPQLLPLPRVAEAIPSARAELSGLGPGCVGGDR